MRGHQLNCYCTRKDWLPVLCALEQKLGLEYIQSGMFPEDTARLVKSVEAISNLGISETGDGVTDRTWLVVQRDSIAVIRKVEQHSGDIRYVIDHGTMPNSVTWRPGGLFGDNVLVKGDLSTTGINPVSKMLFTELKTLLSKNSLKANGYYLGFEAFEKYKSGFRFTDSVRRPREFDLSLPADLLASLSKRSAISKSIPSS